MYPGQDLNQQAGDGCGDREPAPGGPVTLLVLGIGPCARQREQSTAVDIGPQQVQGPSAGWALVSRDELIDMGMNPMDIRVRMTPRIWQQPE